MILLLGATTYVGQAFARALRRRQERFIPLSRNAFDYTCFEFLLDYVRQIRPLLVINAGGRIDPPQQEEEPDRMELLQLNTLLPQTVARACSITNLPWAHVSSASIYCGAKFVENGKPGAVADLSRGAVRKLYDLHPERFRGFSELDEPNFSFRSGPCNFCSGTQALAEEAIRGMSQNYIWRLRLPFNELDEPGNFLARLQASQEIYDTVNSLSHLDECVSACLELWERRAPFGIYNVSNPGTITTREVAAMIQKRFKSPRQFEFRNGGSAPPGNRMRPPDCVLEVSKLLQTGIVLRNVKEALEKSLENWQPQSPVMRRETGSSIVSVECNAGNSKP
jgi:dTDP-4-dehydrorhamnose reductase